MDILLNGSKVDALLHRSQRNFFTVMENLSLINLRKSFHVNNSVPIQAAIGQIVARTDIEPS